MSCSYGPNSLGDTILVKQNKSLWQRERLLMRWWRYYWFALGSEREVLANFQKNLCWFIFVKYYSCGLKYRCVLAWGLPFPNSVTHLFCIVSYCCNCYFWFALSMQFCKRLYDIGQWYSWHFTKQWLWVAFHELDILFLWIGSNFIPDLYQIICFQQIKAWISSCTTVQVTFISVFLALKWIAQTKRYENTTVVRHFWFIPIKLVAKLITLYQISNQFFVVKELHQRSWFVVCCTSSTIAVWKYQSDSLNLDFFYLPLTRFWFHYYLSRDHQLMSSVLSELYYRIFYWSVSWRATPHHLIFVVYRIYVSLEKRARGISLKGFHLPFAHFGRCPWPQPMIWLHVHCV